jgi:homopolymeric O-antigen transport system permease protein
MAAIEDASVVLRTDRAAHGLGLLGEAIREVWSRRPLIRYLVQADLKKKGSDTLLGNIWWVLDPLLQMMVYVILVSIIFRRSEPDYPLFIFAAILPWKWFTSSITDGVMAVTTQGPLIKQIAFPKIVLPLAVGLAEIVNFCFGLLALAGLMILFYHDRISIYLVLIPAIAAVQLVFTMAVTFVVAAVNVFFRDVGNVSRHLLRLWFYLSPGLYSAATLAHSFPGHPTLARMLELNPFYVIFDGYRSVIYNDTVPDATSLAILLAASIVLLALATLLFKRLEPSFAKVL